MLLEQDPSYLILRGPSCPPASEHSKILGRIVSNFAQPLSNSTPEDASKSHVRKPCHTPITNVSRMLDALRKLNIGGKLSNLASITSESKSGTTQEIQSSKVDAYEIEQQPGVFTKMMADTNIRTWVESNSSVFGKPLYMIVGVLVLADTTVSTTETEKDSKAGKVSAPIGPPIAIGSIAAGGPPIDPSIVEDVSGRGGTSGSIKKDHSAEFKEGQIFGFQYKEIRRRKRNIFYGSPVKFTDVEPRIPSESTWGSDAEASQGSVPETDIIELDQSNIAWTEWLEDAEDDEREAVQMEAIDLGDVQIKLVSEIEVGSS